MDHAALRHQMAEVVRAARDTLRDPARAAHLWGQATALCEVIEREGDGSAPRVVVCAALREDIRAGVRSTDDLIEEIVWVVRTVEHDLEDEEREALVDEVVSSDQTDG